MMNSKDIETKEQAEDGLLPPSHETVRRVSMMLPCGIDKASDEHYLRDNRKELREVLAWVQANYDNFTRPASPVDGWWLHQATKLCKHLVDTTEDDTQTHCRNLLGIIEKTASPVDVDRISRDYCKEFYGHDDDFYALPFADYNLLKWLEERGWLLITQPAQPGPERYSPENMKDAAQKVIDNEAALRCAVAKQREDFSASTQPAQPASVDVERIKLEAKVHIERLWNETPLPSGQYETIDQVIDHLADQGYLPKQENSEWPFRWLARAKAGTITMEEAISTIWNSPDNPYLETNPWEQPK